MGSDALPGKSGDDSRNTTRIGVDVGGTFTDFVMVDEARDLIFTSKRLTRQGTRA